MKTTIENTTDIRKKMISEWAKFDRKKLSAADARVHIGFARTVLETHKVEISAAHLALSKISGVHLEAIRTVKPIARKIASK